MEQQVIMKYSHAFKQKVVQEIEDGKLSKSQARKVYDIGGGSTIQSWIKRFGKNELLAKVVRVEMKEETDKIKKLEQEKRALEQALAHSQVKVFYLESAIEAAEEDFGIDIKKNDGLEIFNTEYKK